MAVSDREMEKARQRLSKNLREPSVTNALNVLDKAVTGLIDLAKGKVTEGADGKDLDSVYGVSNENPFGTDYYNTTIGKGGGKKKKNGGVGNLPTASSIYTNQRVAGRVTNTVDGRYAPGNPVSAMGFAKGAYGEDDDDLAAGWFGKGEEEDDGKKPWEGDDGEPIDDEGDGDEGDGEDGEDGEGDGDDDKNAGWFSRAYGDDDEDDDDDDDDDDEDDEDDDDDDEDGGMKARMARLRAMQRRRSSSRQDDDDDEDEEDEDEEDEDEEDEEKSYKSMKRSWSVNDIHKALVAGPNGARVAEVVEASRELAHMVNVFGNIMSDISQQVGQMRRDQHNATTVLASAVNTVVKSQSAIALGLERMAKSTATLAKSGGATGLSKSLSGGVNRPNPGVVMNGKVIAEGAALRRSNALVDETGSVSVPTTAVEGRLTKSIVGGVIQQAVLDGEFSAKDALRWLTETDSPASGPVAVYRQLPAKLQDRIARKADEE